MPKKRKLKEKEKAVVIGKAQFRLWSGARTKRELLFPTWMIRGEGDQLKVVCNVTDDNRLLFVYRSLFNA